MTVSVITALSASLASGGLGISARDPIISPVAGASKLLYDFTNSYCNPNADGAIANGATFNNMVDNASTPTGVVVGTGLINSAGKTGLSFPVNALNPYVNLGTTYDAAASGHAFFWSCWFKIPSAGYVAGVTNLMSLLPSGGNANTSQFSFNTGPTGRDVHCQIAASAGDYAQTPGVGVGTPNNYSIAYIPNVIGGQPGTMNVYYQGALVKSGAAPVALVSAAGQPLLIGQYGIYEFYRSYVEDLTLSGRSSATLAALEYSLNQSRFT